MVARNENCKQNKITKYFETGHQCDISWSQSERGISSKKESLPVQNYSEGEKNCEFESSKKISLSPSFYTEYCVLLLKMILKSCELIF